MTKSSFSGGYRSVFSGRYVTEKHGKASAHTTVSKSPGPRGARGDRYRSAISGQYATISHGQRSPRTTEKKQAGDHHELSAR